MTSPLTRMHSLDLKKSPDADPWCLLCGVNLALNGSTFTVLSRYNNSELCDIFSRVLGAELSDEYASLNVCNRCERQLRRLGRYNSIILARHEGQRLRDQLEKNLAKHGQTIVECGEYPDNKSTTSVPETAEVIQSAPGTKGTPAKKVLKKNKSVDSGVKKSVEFASRPASFGSVRSGSSIDEGGEPRSGRRVKGAGNRKTSIPSPISEKVTLIASSSDKRKDLRRKRWSSTSSTSEDSSVIDTSQKTPPDQRKLSLDSRATSSLSSLQHRSAAFRDAYLPSQKSTDVDKRGSFDHVKGVIPRPSKLYSGRSESLNSEDSIPEDSTMATDDKKGLMEKSESFDQSGRREQFKKSKFFSLGFLSGNSTGSKKKKANHKSPDNQPDDTSKSQDAAAGREEDNAETSEAGTPVHWSNRVNPFDAEEDKRRRGIEDPEGDFEDDLFVKGIVDLDEDSSKDENFQRSDSVQAEEERWSRLDRTDTLNVEDSPISSDEDVDPRDYNADNRSSLSEVEERINIKSQFKGAYYNIGSTEDLLAELADEQAAIQRLKGSKMTPTNSLDWDESDELPKPLSEDDVVEKGQGQPQPDHKGKKGKMLKYESLDLDIDQSNPFFDDVYSEYNRRIRAKGTRSSKSSKSKVMTSEKPETILETDVLVSEEKITCSSNLENSTRQEFESEMSSHADKREGLETGISVESHAGGPDQENAPLIDQEAEEDKENTNKVKMPLFKKKAAPAAPQDPAVASTPNDATTGATDPNAGTTDPNAAATNPNAGNTDPNAGNTDPNAGNTDPNAGNADPNAGAKDVTKTPADAGAPVTAAADQNKSSANGGVTTDAKKSDAADPSVNVDSSKGDAKFSTDSKDPGSDVTQGTGTKKSEKSPLITDHTGPPPKISQSKFKDQAPGFLCCAIL